MPQVFKFVKLLEKQKSFDLHAATIAACLVRSPCAAGWSRNLSSLLLGVPREVKGMSSQDSPPLLLFFLLLR